MFFFLLAVGFRVRERGLKSVPFGPTIAKTKATSEQSAQGHPESHTHLSHLVITGGPRGRVVKSIEKKVTVFLQIKPL